MRFLLRSRLRESGGRAPIIRWSRRSWTRAAGGAPCSPRRGPGRTSGSSSRCSRSSAASSTRWSCSARTPRRSGTSTPARSCGARAWRPSSRASFVTARCEGSDGDGAAPVRPIAYGLALAVCLLPYVVVWVAFEAFDGRQITGAFAKAGLPPTLTGPAGVLAIGLIVLPLDQPRERGWRGDWLAGVPRPAHARVARLHRHEPAGRPHLGGVALSDQRRGLPAPSGQRAALVREHVLHVAGRRRRVHAHVAPAPVAQRVALDAAARLGQRVPGRALRPRTRETEATSYLTTEYGAAFAAMGCLLVVVFWSRRGDVPA